jgi:hypothetical protein
LVDEEEFASFRDWEPFGSADAKRVEAEAVRCGLLAAALWGANANDLQLQLLAPHPEIPAGFGLADLRRLSVQTTALRLKSARHAWVAGLGVSAPAIFAGDRQYSAREARWEILRRAIDYLEGRGGS